MKKSIIVASVLLLVALAGFGVYKVVNKPSASVANTSEQNQATTQPSVQDQTSSGSIAATEAVTITYTNDGFSPKSVTVKTGGMVTIKNDSSRNVQFDSDPHPAHTDNQELNAELIKAGGSDTFTVKRTGTFGYHNHLNASETGTIVVQ